jgi:hypothetical protein
MLQTLLLVHSQLLIVHREIVPVVGNGGGGTGASIRELITNAVVRAKAHAVDPATIAVPHYPSMDRSKRRKVSPIDETSDSTTSVLIDDERISIDSEPTNESITRSLNFRAELMAIMNHPTGVESVRTGGQ